MTLELSITDGLMLVSAGCLAGVANAIAGGGTFISFPAFLWLGLPPVVANASNAVAVWPGHALATWGYRHDLRLDQGALKLAGVVAGVGGALGAYLLSTIGNAAFVKLIPFLLFAATLVFAMGPKLNKHIATREDPSVGAGVLIGIFVFSVYGGFFGAGLGIMLMAGLLILGVRDPHQNNALKNLLATVVTSVGVFVLSLSGLVDWPATLCAFAGAVLGGLIGARVAKFLSPQWLRACVMVLGFTLTAHYGYKYYFSA
jgi:uncharacterized membrane protein YfcA